MGQVRLVACSNCDFSKNIEIGGGMRNFMTLNPFPALCRTCNTITSYNMALKTQAVCLTCGTDNFLAYGDQTRLPAETDDLMQFATAELNELLSEFPDDTIEPDILASLKESYVPDWDAGHHLCPSCGTFGLQFLGVSVFFD